MKIRRLLQVAVCTSFVLISLSSAKAQVYGYNHAVVELARQLIENAQLDSGATLTVVPFVTLDNKETDFGRLLAEDLTTLVYKYRRFTLVERDQLDKAIREIKLEDPDVGLTDPKTAQRLGRMVNAKAILIGTHQNLGSSTRVNARIIGVSTGEILSVGSVEIENARFLGNRSGNASTGPNVNAKIDIDETIYIGGDWLTIVFDRVELVSRDFLKFTFTLKNPFDYPVNFSLNNPRANSYVVDEYGNASDYVSSQGINNGQQKTTKAGERYSFSLLFRSRPLKGQTLELHSAWQAYGGNVNGTKNIVEKGIPRPQ